MQTRLVEHKQNWYSLCIFGESEFDMCRIIIRNSAHTAYPTQIPVKNAANYLSKFTILYIKRQNVRE